MYYPSTPLKICAIFLAHRHKGSAFLALVLVMAIVSSLFSLGSAKVTQAAMNGTSSNKTSLQAQQYAVSEAALLQAVPYSDLKASAKAEIPNSSYFTETSLSSESNYTDATKKDALPRSTIKLIRYSAESTSSSVPQGSIIPWYGSSENIPNGFALCDGKNGTPDLRDKFLVGAGASYALGNIGGASSVLLSEDNIANHRHLMFVPEYRTLGRGYFYQSLTNSTYVSVGGNSSSGSCEEKYNMVAAASSVPSIGLTGYAGTNHPKPFDNRPPYYALYYLMKL